MAFMEVDEPAMLDSTGQEIVDKLDELVGSISPSADNVSFDNTGTGLTSSDVEGAIKELNDNKIDGSYNIKMGTINSIQTLSFTTTIGFVFFFGTSLQIGILGCRPNAILEIVPIGSQLSYSVNGTTFTFTQSNTNTAARYLAIYV